MLKVLVYSPDKCSGCRTCELVCSLQHLGVCNPSRSRVRILKMGEYLFLPIRCRQCEDPICVRICPMRAISKNDELGCVEVNLDVCVGCRMCVEYCPFGGAQMDFVTRKIAVCDLCGGEPACVRFCATDALDYVELDEMTLRKRDEFFKIWTEYTRTSKNLKIF